MRWTEETDCSLGMLLVEQRRMGNRSKTVAYDAAISTLTEMFHFNFTKNHVENWIKVWKKLYGSVKQLLQLGEFKWDKKCKCKSTTTTQEKLNRLGLLSSNIGRYHYKTNPQ